MKFERWNTDTREFEFVDLSETEYEEFLVCFQITEAECLIEERIELLKDCKRTNIMDIFYKNEEYD